MTKTTSVLFFCCLTSIIHSGAAENSGSIENGDFRLTYSESGVTGLANPHDPFGAEIVPQGQRLGLTARFRSKDGDWQTLPAAKLQRAEPSQNKLVYATDASDSSLKVTQTFATDGSAL